MKTIGFIGTGNIASAILKGVVNAGITPNENIFIFDVDTSKTDLLNKQYGVSVAATAPKAASCDAVICAVKPNVMPAVLNEINKTAKEKGSLIISTAAGLELSTLITALNGYDCVVRIMPNLNAAVCHSCTAMCAAGGVSDEQKNFSFQILKSFGSVFEIRESLFSAFTAVAGSAPAFVFEFINDLAFAGVKHGLTRSDALEIAASTVLGSALTLLESNVHPSEMTDKVCSPGGTTAAGVAALREYGFDNSVIKAVDKTVEKADKMK